MADYTNLDFNEIKTDIKNYIKDNSPLLADYNYEGSIISSIINVMAYVTQYNAHYLNMVATETTLATAKKESVIYKLANMLNYLPKRNVAPYCDVSFTNTGSTTRYVYFGSKFFVGSLPLVYLGSTITLEQNETETFRVYNGELIDRQWISDGRPFQTYALNDRVEVDNDMLYVAVADTALNLNFNWQNINTTNPQVGGKYYYIDYLDQMSIKFDDGSVYQKPNSGQTVAVRYLKNSGSLYNGSVAVNQNVTTNIQGVTGVTLTALDGGSNGESLEEIKNRAILMFTTQNRAITKQDYYNLITKYSKFNEYQSVSVYGGEEVYIDIDGNEVELALTGTWNDVGYVYLSILKSIENIYNVNYLNETEKQEIEQYLAPYKIITMFFKFTDPVIVYVKPKIRLKLVSYVGVQVQTLEDEINENLFNRYNGMNKTFSVSNVVNYLDDIDTIDYCEMEFTLRMLVKKDELEYKVVPMANKIQDIKGYYAKLDFSGIEISPHCYILDGTDKYMITNVTDDVYISYVNEGGLELTLGVYDVYSSEDELIGSVEVLNTNKLYISDVTEESIIYIDNDSLQTYQIGTINCETGFNKFMTMEDTLLSEMSSFIIEVTLQDDISFNVKRELFLCPEMADIEYI
mgnify:CR=1 FL=1